MAEIFGYEFRNAELLERALVTPSCKMDRRDIPDNQRLEFLGDAVLGLMAAERLYQDCPSEQEGELTVRRSHLVSTAPLCDAAERHGLIPRLRLNRGAANLPPRSKTVADAVEAVIGAAYLDGGLDAARQVFDALELTENAESGSWRENPKGDLQIATQAMTPPRLPVYTQLGVSGKSHEPVFTVKVSVEGVGEATASAGSRRAAEAEAAAQLLHTIVPS